VVIHSSKCFFCHLRTDLLKFPPERNILVVAVNWTKGQKGFSVKEYYLASILLIINI